MEIIEKASPILDVADIYVGFNLWDIVAANYDIQKLLVEDGFLILSYIKMEVSILKMH